jgi:hypothetical protein
MSARKSVKAKNPVDTVEEEYTYMSKVWYKLDMHEQITVITYMFLFLYVILVSIASYDELTKSSNPSAGRAIFYLMAVTLFITIAPALFHYLGISTYGVIHILGIAGSITFVVALWLIFEYFDKRTINSEEFKDPYSMSIYFLLITFSVMIILGSISRKM